MVLFLNRVFSFSKFSKGSVSGLLHLSFHSPGPLVHVWVCFDKGVPIHLRIWKRTVVNIFTVLTERKKRWGWGETNVFQRNEDVWMLVHGTRSNKRYSSDWGSPKCYSRGNPRCYSRMRRESLKVLFTSELMKSIVLFTRASKKSKMLFTSASRKSKVLFTSASKKSKVLFTSALRKSKALFKSAIKKVHSIIHECTEEIISVIQECIEKVQSVIHESIEEFYYSWVYWWNHKCYSGVHRKSPKWYSWEHWGILKCYARKHQCVS